MKRALKVAVVFLLCAVLCASSASACIFYPIYSIKPVGSSIEIVDETEDSVTLRKTDGSPFKIIMFTDTHFAVPTKKDKLSAHKLTAKALVMNIEREKPDLVLFGGDNVTSGFNRLRSHQFARILEKLGVYWGGVLGNHEGDNNTSIHRDTMVKIFSSYNHCLMRQGKSDVDGNCNYTIRILNADGSLKHAFICLDSFDRMSEADMERLGVDPADDPYDFVKQSQIDWYTSQVAAMKKEFGSCPSSVVLHIPLTQYQDAFDLVEKGKLQFLWGEKEDGIYCSAYDSGLFDAIVASRCTKTVFCGHDHMNSFGVNYKGIVLTYINPSGYGTYGFYRQGEPESRWQQGFTRLTLADDGTFTLEQVRNCDLYSFSE